jgi:hypothetical protein
MPSTATDSPSPDPTDQGSHDAGALALRRHGLDEAAVDLHLVELKIAQMIEVRTAGPEIIEDYADTRRPQCAKCGAGAVQIGDKGAFRDLQLEPFRRQAGFLQQANDPRGEKLVLELAGIDVGREANGCRPFRVRSCPIVSALSSTRGGRAPKGNGRGGGVSSRSVPFRFCR